MHVLCVVVRVCVDCCCVSFAALTLLVHFACVVHRCCCVGCVVFCVLVRCQLVGHMYSIVFVYWWHMFGCVCFRSPVPFCACTACVYVSQGPLEVRFVCLVCSVCCKINNKCVYNYFDFGSLGGVCVW